MAASPDKSSETKRKLPHALSPDALSKEALTTGGQPGWRTSAGIHADALEYETGAENLAAGLPALLLDADRIANAVALGVHGRRRPGIGESFWQFRRYRDGDTPASIDWRRSARSHRLYVRDNEWEAAATVWFWLNRHPAMAFRSHLTHNAKAERALLLALALGSLLTRGGERIGLFGSGQAPRADRQAVPRMAESLCKSGLANDAASSLPPDIDVSKHASLVIFSDFLDPITETEDRLSALAARGLQGHLVQILDPAEEVFPYQGRHEFTEISGKGRLIIGRAEDLGTAYRARLDDHRTSLKRLARSMGWTFNLHHTDQSPSKALLALFALMAGDTFGNTAEPVSSAPGFDANTFKPANGDSQQAAD